MFAERRIRSAPIWPGKRTGSGCNTIQSEACSIASLSGGVPSDSVREGISTLQRPSPSIRSLSGRAGRRRGTPIKRDTYFRPSTYTTRASEQVANEYTPGGQLGSVSSGSMFGDTVMQMLTYDSAGRLSVQVKGDGSWGYRFTYDALGRLSSDSQVVAPGPPD